MNRVLSLLAIVTAFLFAARSFGDDWPQFRGPTGQGHFLKGSLPTEWGPAKNVVWKQKIPGHGWSSPVIAGGKIYLTTSEISGDKNEEVLSLRALCIDASKGSIDWNVEVFQQRVEDAYRIHGKNSHASPTAIVDGDRIIVHFGHQGTAALDKAGKILWKNETLKYSPVHGNGGTPALVGPALVYSADGGNTQSVIALDRATGNLLWKTERDTKAPKKFAFSTPLVISVDGKEQIVSPGAGFVAAYEPEKGTEIWRVHYGSGYSVVPRPVFGYGMVFLSSGFDSPVLYAIRVDGLGDVTKSHVAWTLKKGAPLTPSPLLVGEELYTISDNGLASCLDAKTGKIHWQERISGSHSASPIFADGKIFFLSEDGIGTVVKAAKEFEVLARNELGEKTLASYAATDGALFVRTEKHLYRIQNR
jgi:outer membrane protein assembly factor BamB